MGLISRVSSRTYRYKNCANMVNATEVSEQVPATETPTVEELKAKVYAEAPVEEKAADDAKPVAEVEKTEEVAPVTEEVEKTEEVAAAPVEEQLSKEAVKRPAETDEKEEVEAKKTKDE